MYLACHKTKNISRKISVFLLSTILKLKTKKYTMKSVPQTLFPLQLHAYT